METSPDIAFLAGALAAAQGAMGGAVKDSTNPFYKSKYADLESVWSACRKALSDNGLSVIQTVTADDVKTYVTTILAHSSGQWIRETLPLNPKPDIRHEDWCDQRNKKGKCNCTPEIQITPQGIGSAISYGRRYALAAFVGVYQSDDDGEAAENRKPEVHDPEALVGIGKHGKKSWREVNDDYLHWASENDCPPALKAGAKAEIKRRLDELTEGIGDDIPYESVSTT